MPKQSVNTANGKSSFLGLERLFETNERLEYAKAFAQYVRAGQDAFPGAWLDHPLGDEWREFTLTTLQMWLAPRAGYVYLVHVPGNPSTLKVGQTSQDPWRRLSQLNHEILVSKPALYDAVFTHDRWHLEAQVHHQLKGLGLHAGKEHFFADPQDTLTLVRKMHTHDEQLFYTAGVTELLPPL